jgi:RNA polymerase sigma-70 factor (ECF subfamily)
VLVVGLSALDKKLHFMCHTHEVSTRKKEPLGTQRFTPEEVKALYERHASALAAYACCCGLDFASAEDVVQQVFVKLLRAGEPGPLLPLAYAYRAVRNSSMNLRRDRQRETQLPENETWLIRPGGKPEEALALQQALRELPPEQQEAVFLRIWSGMTLQEIADASETPLHTVASRYRYALEKLRERLK